MFYFRCGWQFYELRKTITGNFVKTAVDLMVITELIYKRGHVKVCSYYRWAGELLTRASDIWLVF